MGLSTRRVADDTETQERHLVQMTGVGDGRTLHVYGQRFGEGAEHSLEFRGIGDELIAGAGQSAAHGRLDGGIVGQVARHSQQTCVGIEASRQPLHLTVGIALAAPHIVVDGRSGSHHAHHTGFGCEPAGTARADHRIGTMSSDQRRRCECRVHLSDAAHGQHHRVVAQTSRQYGGRTERGRGKFGAVREQRRNLVMLDLHGRDDSYFHRGVFMEICLQKYGFSADIV